MFNDYFNSELMLDDYEKEKRSMFLSESLYAKKFTFTDLTQRSKS